MIESSVRQATIKRLTGINVFNVCSFRSTFFCCLMEIAPFQTHVLIGVCVCVLLATSECRLA